MGRIFAGAIILGVGAALVFSNISAGILLAGMIIVLWGFPIVAYSYADEDSFFSTGFFLLFTIVGLGAVFAWFYGLGDGEHKGEVYGTFLLGCALIALGVLTDRGPTRLLR